jgi:aspartate aminotransferase
MKGSDRLEKLSESQTLALTKRVRELQAQGRDIVGLTLGEPDFDTPTHIRNAAIDAIRDGFTHYPPVAGIPDLRQAVADKFKRDYGLAYKPANVVVSTGAKQSVINVVMSLLNPGDECVLIAPYWVSYLEMIKMADGEARVVDTDVANGYKLDPADLEAAITPQTRLIIFNSPNNPTGTTYSRAELKAIAEVLARHPQVYIISDEIYEHLAYDTETACMASFPEIAERVIVVNGVSKGFAMTGWRIGYIVAPVWIAQLCEKFQGQITSGACSISQKATVAALTGPMEPTFAMRDEFKKRRDFMGGELNKIPGLKNYTPDGAFYFYPDVSHFIGKRTPGGVLIADVDDLSMYLLDEGGVAVIPGTAFGTDKHVRISYAYGMDLLRKGLQRISESLTALQ